MATLLTDGDDDAGLLRLVAPNGLRVVGTLERLSGRSNVSGFVRGPDGGFDPQFTGYTAVFWDGQVTARTDTGVLIVLDSDGNAWPVAACAVDDAQGAV